MDPRTQGESADLPAEAVEAAASAIFGTYGQDSADRSLRIAEAVLSAATVRVDCPNYRAKLFAPGGTKKHLPDCVCEGDGYLLVLSRGAV